MATLPTQVRPGDIISADLINALLDELAELKGTGGGGGSQVVPNVFGTFLVDARALITAPSQQLTLGFTFDVNGAAVDPLVPANQNLIVLNQSPVADARVAPNTPVNLVVSASAASTPAPAPSPPTITRTERPNGTTATAFAVGTTMVIVGTNFSATAGQNTVRFATVTQASTPDPSDPTRRLLVVVPTGIPGAPVNSGDAALAGVTVSVTRTGSATTATTTITVNPPVASQPTISTVTPGTAFETANITITGTNFTAGAQVFIRNVSATVVSVNATTIVATVPNFVDILPGPPVTVSLRVLLTNGSEVNFTGLRVSGA